MVLSLRQMNDATTRPLDEQAAHRLHVL